MPRRFPVCPKCLARVISLDYHRRNHTKRCKLAVRVRSLIQEGLLPCSGTWQALRGAGVETRFEATVYTGEKQRPFKRLWGPAWAITVASNAYRYGIERAGTKALLKRLLNADDDTRQAVVVLMTQPGEPIEFEHLLP